MDCHLHLCSKYQSFKAMKKLIIAHLVMLLLCVLACKKDNPSPMSPAPAPTLSGSYRYSTGPENPSIFNLTLKTDSFYIKVHYFTDAIIMSDPCYSQRYEYVCGTYKSDGSTLFFKGNYTDENYQPGSSYSCNITSGKFEKALSYSFKGDTLFVPNLWYQSSGNDYVIRQ